MWGGKKEIKNIGWEFSVCFDFQKNLNELQY
jgi:hypothetical protein